MDSTQVGVHNEADQVSPGGFLQRRGSRGPEAEVILEVLGNLATLKGQLADQEVSALLLRTAFAQDNSSGPVTMGLLDPSGSRADLRAALVAICLRGGGGVACVQ